jgi:hypothetical protein
VAIVPESRPILTVRALRLFRFHDLLCPPADPAEFERLLSKHGLQHTCPIPMPPYHGPLAELLNQTSAHAHSADFTYLLATCYDRMERTCLDQFASQVYDEIVLLDSSDEGFQSHDGARVESLKSKRLVECLPFLTTWSRGVWARVPDEAIEVRYRSYSRHGTVALTQSTLGSAAHIGSARGGRFCYPDLCRLCE